MQLTDAERAHRHRIFGAFLRHAPDTAPDNRTLFERLHHLDQAQALDPVPGQNAELALLNFEAARRAEQAGALATARRYLQQGRNLARQTDAAELRQPTFETGLRLARLESTNGRHDIAAEILNESAGLARDPASRSALTLAWNQLLLQRGRPQEALDRLCSGLAEHGVEIPGNRPPRRRWRWR
ncbi:hypothetical protein [Marinobacterium aestuariivivens]|uniref:Tetratrico peptide repeat group 5 domain-containing protein n=1 Tax=Marinobacterium aestuariivivens TaxID=1698799 RepID=A0ABW2A5F6_9GAMM